MQICKQPGREESRQAEQYTLVNYTSSHLLLVRQARRQAYTRAERQVGTHTKAVQSERKEGSQGTDSYVH